MNTAMAVLLAVLACAVAAAAAPQDRQFSQQFLDEEYNRYRQQVPYYPDALEEETEELSFFQRLIRPWNWISYIRDYFSSSSEDDEDYAEVYDAFPGAAAYPGAQVSRLDERPPPYYQQYRPQQQPQQYPQQYPQQQQQYRPRPIHNQYQEADRVEAPYPQAGPPQAQLGRSHPEQQEHADAVNLGQEQEYAGQQESQPLA